MEEPAFHTMSDGRRIAHRFTAGRGPTLVFLPGYKSDMSGGKATALYAWAKEHHQGCLLLDYSGCGASSGDFADGTLSRWTEDVVALVEAKRAEGYGGPVILVGSSLGGWLMLLVALRLGERVAGLIGIAAAPDFTEWGYDGAQKAALARGETVFETNPYGSEPTPTHPGFWVDGQRQRVLDGRIMIDCPVRLIHGQADADVPFEVSLRLADTLHSADVQVTLIKDGDHRLSREADIALLLRTVAALADELS
ncbi:alpha/beta fold hydrolase [Novosphingobium sp. Gsoil 351]|uniref:alpha/beta fold hydrolase n=1 Tax=Novosphingobium sp. Gsoil 351 TaxID=2675225 RepID=UPI0012B4EF5C|nr:alpha/beta hydrolase [Novosphingobium sp. Gsoil 351]QGN55387.1 alpha/beta fold hydrolase [Novosphingobium sp. Gsoil 351]